MSSDIGLPRTFKFSKDAISKMMETPEAGVCLCNSCGERKPHYRSFRDKTICLDCFETLKGG